MHRATVDSIVVNHIQRETVTEVFGTQRILWPVCETNELSVLAGGSVYRDHPKLSRAIGTNA